MWARHAADDRGTNRDLTGAGRTALTVLRRDRIGMVFQAFNLLPTLTAAEYIRLPLTPAARRASSSSPTGAS